MITDYIMIAVCNLFLMFVIWQFYDDMYELKDDKKCKRFALGVPWLLCSYLTSELFHSITANVIVNIVFLYIMLIPYKASYVQKLAAVLLIELINGACDYASYILFVTYYEYGDIYAISYVGTVVLVLICEILLRRFLRRNKGIKYDYNEMIVLLIIPIVMLVVLVSFIKSGSKGVYVYVIGACALVASFASFFLYNILISNHMERMEKEALDKQIDAYRRELDRIEKTELRIEGIRHDLRHHIIEMEGLIERDDYGSLINYLDCMKNDLSQDEKLSRSGKYEIDSLINYLLDEAGDSLKEVNVNIAIPEDLNIERYRLNIILGNLLENAIEASKRSEEKMLSLFVKVDRNVLFVEMANSYSVSPIINENRFITLKDNKSKHGFGLRNVERIVNEYDGELKLDISDGCFKVGIIMYL